MAIIKINGSHCKYTPEQLEAMMEAAAIMEKSGVSVYLENITVCFLPDQKEISIDQDTKESAKKKVGK